MLNSYNKDMKETKYCVDCGDEITDANKTLYTSISGGKKIRGIRKRCRSCHRINDLKRKVEKQENAKELTCSKCGKTKPKDEFMKSKFTSIDGFEYVAYINPCKQCKKEAVEATREAKKIVYTKSGKKTTASKKKAEADRDLEDRRFTKKEAEDWRNRSSVFDKPKALEWAKINLTAIQIRKQELFIEGLDR